jgi:hypothetical protein
MASVGQPITITTAATLVFMCVDKETYLAQGYTPTANPNIFVPGTTNDPRPLLIVLPASTTVIFGGASMTSSANGASIPSSSVPSFAVNVVGGDSLYALVATGSAVLQLLAMRL